MGKRSILVEFNFYLDNQSEDSGNINWSKLLVEELSEMMKKKEEELNDVRKRTQKVISDRENDLKIHVKLKPSGTLNIPNKKKNFRNNSFANTNRYGKEKSGRGGQTSVGDNTSISRYRRGSSIMRSNAYSDSDWSQITLNDPRLGKLKKASRSDDLSNEDMEDLKSIFPQELMEVLDFHDFKKVLLEHLQDPLFQQLLKERFKAHDRLQNR